VALLAGAHVVQAHHLVSIVQQPHANMKPNESASTSNQYFVFWKRHFVSQSPKLIKLGTIRSVYTYFNYLTQIAIRLVQTSLNP
jgi:hypothetical protein